MISVGFIMWLELPSQGFAKPGSPGSRPSSAKPTLKGFLSGSGTEQHHKSDWYSAFPWQVAVWPQVAPGICWCEMHKRKKNQQKTTEHKTLICSIEPTGSIKRKIKHTHADTHSYICMHLCVYRARTHLHKQRHVILANNTLVPWFQQTLSTFTVQNSTLYCNATENSTSLPHEGVMNLVFLLLPSECTLEELTEFGDSPQIAYKSIRADPQAM